MSGDGGGPVRAVVDVDGVPMSALVRQVPQPRAVVLALHGGSARSAYWDCPNHPRLSLLRTGAALGFTVVALDRPGYAGSGGHAEAAGDPERRADLAHAAVDRLLAARPRGAGLFVVGHSIGCELALRMAAGARGADLLGVGLAGIGRHHHAAALTILEGARPDPSAAGRAGLWRLLWQPERLYPPDIVGGAAISSRTPAYEGAVADLWAARLFPELAARVRVPVHYTLGEHERIWRAGPEALADVAGMFAAAPHVAVDEQADGGHNLSVGWTATAYHLKVLSFVEECAVRRESGGVDRMSDAG